MSTYWGLHCKPCDSHTGSGKNHGEDVLSDFVRMAPLFIQLRELDSQGYLEIEMLGGFDGDTDVYLIDWLCQHAVHEIELYNEYGHYAPLSRP